MKNLTIRRLALGVLMTFVLAFGVQGVAEALAIDGSGLTTATPDNVHYVGSNFTGSISVTLNTNPTVTFDHDDDPNTEDVTRNVRESVSISANGITFTTPIFGRSSLSRTEKADETGVGVWPDDVGATAAFTLQGYFTSVGKKTITVTDTTNYPAGYPQTPETKKYTYTFYVVQSNNAISQTTTISLVGLSSRYQILQHQGRQPFVINSGSGNYPVRYSVVPASGAGTLHRDGTTAGSLTAVDTSTNAISSAVKVYLDANGTASAITPGSTTTVVVSIGESTATERSNFAVPYIFGTPQLIAAGPDGSDDGTTIPALADNMGRSDSPGGTGQEITNAFTAHVNDGKVIPVDVPHALVKFEVQDKSRAGGKLRFVGGTNAGTLVDSQNRYTYNANGMRIITTEPTDTGKLLYVRADVNGVANVNFQLGTAGEQKVTITSVGISKEVSAFTEAISGLRLASSNIDKRSGASGLYDVYVSVENDGEPVGAGYEVEFSTSDGVLSDTPTGTAVDLAAQGQSDTTFVQEITDGQGVAYVVYDPKGNSGNLRVTARIRADAMQTLAATERVGNFVDQLVLNVTGGSVTPATQPTPTTNPTLTLSPSTLTGAASSNVALAATVRNAAGNTVQGIGVSFTLSTTNSGAILTPTAITNANGVAQTNIVLPNTNATVTATAIVGGVSLTQQASITVTDATADTGTGTGGTDGQVTAVPESITISGSSSFTGEANVRLNDLLAVRILDTNGQGSSGETVFFSIVEGRGRLSPGRTRTDGDGYAEITFTPLSTGTIVVEAASGDLDPVTFTITTGEPPAAIVLVSGNNQSGRPGTRLANPFVVEVVDENDDPVSGASVTFAVTAGGGSLSVTSVTTNGTGRAQTYLRLGDEVGENTVVARVTGLTAVTFTATSGAEVLVSAAQRPPMYWISRTEGKLHRLVADEVENLAPNIDNITSLTIDTQNQLLYWTRQTAESRSAIQRAGLNGRGVITLQTSLTLMTSLAVDSTGTTLYWADILGKIKSRPVQGNRVTLLAQNLSSPTGLVWANEYLYWGEATGQIRRMNLRNNRRTIETITTSSGEPVSLAVQSGRVYWTEISGNAAQLNRVNTNGTGVEALKTLVGSRRVWIDVDGSASKLYLTRASKLERRGLSGRSTVTLVSGLASPGSLVLGGELPTSPPVVSQPTQPTQPPVASKYDVNEDGKVNNADTRAVAGAVGQSGAAITNPRTDVDGSGTVDVTDLILVIANLDADVAAPAIDIDVKALDVDFDRVQEQVEVLLASGDRSIAAQRALLYLQHLLASARPDETVLLANYPNPFNPETWIPYHLAESTDVRVNIYDAQGTLVRVLPLGHQTAGYYTSRSRAAYWDGLNALGERVASGIYFYQLQTDAVSPMRKMVILK